MKSKYIFLTLLFLSNLLYSQLPVASYPFNGNANDVSGNGNNGILAGQTANPVLTADRFGNANSAYLFGGYYNKNWIQIPNSSTLAFTNQMSVSLWFKQCTFAGMDGWGNYSPNGYHILFSKAGDGIAANPGVYSGIYTSPANLLYISIGNINGYGQPHNFDASTTVNCFDTCEWIHFVVVVNDTNLKMYFNGQLSLQQTINPAIFSNANTQDFFLGRMNGGGTIWYPFNGIIDDVNIYNVAISQSKVTSLYGNYVNPLAINNIITLDSLKVINSSCGTSNTGSISIYPNSNNAPYQFSIDGGNTYQSSGIYTNLGGGSYSVKIKTNCNVKDTIIHISALNSINTSNSVSICNGQNYMGHTTSGIYKDTLTAINGCDSIITTNLTVSSTLQLNLNATSDTICAGNSTTISATGAASYLWNYGLGTASSISVSPSITTKYIVIGTLSGCLGKDSITISVNPKPVVSIAPLNPSICKGDSLSLVASSNTAATTFSWSNGGNTNTIKVSPAITTTYTVIGTKNFCNDTASVNLMVNPIPVVSISPANPSICKGDTITLNATSNLPSTTYTWNNAATTSFIKINPAVNSSYYVIGKLNQCVDTAFVNLTVKPLPIISVTANNNPICEGESAILTAASNMPSTNYLWSNSSTANPLTVSPLVSTYFLVKGTASNCHDTAGINIMVISKQNLNLGIDSYLCAGDELIITANNLTGTYLWSNGSNSSILTLTEPGVYWLKVDNNGCITSDTIEMKKCSEIWVPNVFTPNNDGINDIFKAITKEIQKLQLYIYNRWGNMVFETHDVNMGWDGKYAGGDAQSGVYYWLIRYNENRSSNQNVEKEIHGSVTLLR